MRDVLKGIVEQADQLTYDEIESLRSFLFSINYDRKMRMDNEIKELSQSK